MAEAVTVTQGFTFALDPTPAQERALRSHCGGQKFAYNWAIGTVKANLDQRAAERSYGIPDQGLTPSLPWNAYALRKQWNNVKDVVASWWGENSKEAYASGIANAVAALSNFAASRAGRRKGERMGFPRFKNRRSRPSCHFSTGAMRLTADRRGVVLPRLGSIRTHERTGKLARHVERGTGVIKSATVSLRRGRWFVALTCQIERRPRPVEYPGRVVGVDLGVSALAVLSTGETVANPRHLEAAQARLRRQSRTVARRAGPDGKTGRAASKRWQAANAKRNRTYHRVANLREDGLHKVTSWLSTRYGTIVIEDLNVAGMLGLGRGLARGLGDAAMGEMRRQLTYKTDWSSADLAVADRWFPSSKTCSACGVVKAKLPLRVRVFTCASCGLEVDRDLNAAINLAKLADGVLGSTGSGLGTDAGDGVNGRGDRVRPVATLAVVAEASTLRRFRASDEDLPPREGRDRHTASN